MTSLHNDCCAKGEVLNDNTGRCGFPQVDWGDEFKGNHEIRLSKQLFDPSHLLLDPPPSDVEQECRRLLCLQSTRDAVREKRIISQAGHYDNSVMPLWRVLCLADYYDPTNGPLRRLKDNIHNNIVKTTFIFKRCFMRTRPYHRSNELQPVFRKGAPDYPGHPAYPSGHATMVYAWAHLYKSRLSLKHAHLGDELLYAAKEVAENREWAGVHFASDTRAGESLGEQIAHAIVQGGGLSGDDFRLLMPGLT